MYVIIREAQKAYVYFFGSELQRLASCRFQTLYEIFSELNRSGSGRSEAQERGPVLLLLGGGMAAGKSTVREIIGHDDFWSKVPFHAVSIEGCETTMASSLVACPQLKGLFWIIYCAQLSQWPLTGDLAQCMIQITQNTELLFYQLRSIKKIATVKHCSLEQYHLFALAATVADLLYNLCNGMRNMTFRQVGKDAVVIEADAIKNRDVMYKHLSSNDFTRNDPLLSSYVHEYSTKAAEAMLVAAGELNTPF